MKQTCFLLAFAAVLAAAPASHAATLNVYQGADLSDLGLGTYGGAANVTLIEGVGGNNFSTRNYGGQQSLNVGRDTYTGTGESGGQRRALLRFDLTDLSGVIDNITSVTLTMTLLNLPTSNSTNLELNLFEVASANAGWVQGTGNPAVVPGAATWNHRSFSSESWAGSSGLGTAGTDYIDTVIDGTKTVTTGTSGITGTTVTWTLSVEMIEAWIAGENAGLLFALGGFESAANGDFLSMAVSSNSNFAYRPTLTINYSPVPEPGTVGLLLGSATLLGLLRGVRRKAA